MLKITCPLFYNGVFYNVSLLEKIFLGCSASHEDVTTRCGHCQNWLQSMLLVFALLGREVCLPDFGRGLAS